MDGIDILKQVSSVTAEFGEAVISEPETSVWRSLQSNRVRMIS
jgi:hypothetical protein